MNMKANKWPLQKKSQGNQKPIHAMRTVARDE